MTMKPNHFAINYYGVLGLFARRILTQAPSVGDKVVFNDEQYNVTLVEWCLDEDATNYEYQALVNVVIESVDKDRFAMGTPSVDHTGEKVEGITMSDDKAYIPFKTVLLSDEGVTLGEYIESVLCGDNVPAAIIMSESNKAVMADIPSRDILLSADKTIEQMEREQEEVERIKAGTVISSDANLDNNTLLLTYDKKPTAQGISGASITRELGKLVESIQK